MATRWTFCSYSTTQEGCVIRTRVVGAIEAEQSDDGKKWIRNNRLIGVATHAQLHGNAEMKEINARVLDEIEAFFEHNLMQGKRFRPTERVGSKRAQKLIGAGQAVFAQR